MCVCDTCMRLHRSCHTRLTSSGVQKGFLAISTITRLFKPKTFLVLLKVCPHHTDMILGPCSEPCSRKTANNFHQAESRVYPPSSGDSITKCGSCTYSSGKLENNPKEAFIRLKEKRKKSPRQCTRGPAMQVLQSGRCRDQV